MLAPMIVAGPLVRSPGRAVDHIVDSVDVFALFGEIAGVDVRASVPYTQTLDAQPVIPYLTNPSQGPVRRNGFTELGTGLKPSSVKLWPCVIQAGPVYIATDVLFTSEALCHDNGGTWFGPTASQPNPPYATSCAVRAAGIYPSLTILPPQVWALRNDRYKLVQFERPSCDNALGDYEFYDLSARSTSNPIGLDLASANLLTNGQPTRLTSAQVADFTQMSSELATLRASQPVCYGDGNLDGRVDAADALGVSQYNGRPSVFDFNKSGSTGPEDLQCVTSNLGNDCRRSGPGKACQ